MDFIRRKYLIHVIENNINVLRDDAVNKVSNFTLNHVLALRYLITTFPKAILTKDVFSNPNFFVFLHMAQSRDVFDAVLKAAFDAPTMYIKALVKHYTLFSNAIQTYKDLCQKLITDDRFIEVVKFSSALKDVIGVNYDLTLNPLFYKEEPIQDIEIVFTKLFKETKFKAVKKLPVLRLMIWAYLSKQDTGIEFEDNDRQDIFTIFQKVGPVIHSHLTEQFREFMFSKDKTSYWIWLNDKISNDSDIYKDRLAETMYEKILSYIYFEVTQGRVNKNMLKLVYIFEDNVEIKQMLLEIIYGVPGDILGIINNENEEWKQYFIHLYKESFIDGNTFVNEKTFYDNLFNVVAAIDPVYFKAERITSLFTVDVNSREMFDKMKINSTYISQIIYETLDIDMYLLEKQVSCQIYNENTVYYIKEYNTYKFLSEDDPLVINKGSLVKLSSINDIKERIDLFSLNILKYYLDGRLASIGLVLDDYAVDIVSKMLSHMKCIENVSCFIKFAVEKNESIIPAIIRTIIANFNVPVIVLFRDFLKQNLHHVETFFDNTKYLQENDKKYIRAVIEHGR
ncbi:imv protein, virion morphogenesis [Pteropox virus]|uniref:Protein E6 homolog n=1 Tax=Pteropox virus TaxID=1873698 RepID=A0A1B1MRF3_9POXV|nr:imv protein, virion morphogenesis [Pteropox virus]ANS71119.1 imv protein, virion morphogenesis [Pteropox virus]